MWRKWKFHQAIVTRLAIACSAVAISLALIALAVAARWDVRWGDLGTWLAGIGSLLAAVAAVGIAIHTDNKQKRKEEEERAESAARALRRARRIVLKNDRYRENHKPNGAGGTSRYTVTLQNTGSTSIYEIRWGRPFVVHANLLSDFDSSEMRPTLAWPKSAVLAHEPDVDVLQADPLVLSENCGTSIDISIWRRGGTEQAVGKNGSLPFTTYHRVSYIDEEGFHLGWVYREREGGDEDDPLELGLLNPFVKGQWALVDDDYPDSTNDALVELISKLPPADKPDSIGS
jgi:hypothetical protein